MTPLPDPGRWLTETALPFWASAGIDTATGTAWEALDHAGRPRPDMVRRLRVQVRQAYCLAAVDPGTYLPLARQLFRFAMDHGFDPETGNLAATLHPDLSIRTAPHDLYDMAFMLLAAAALIRAGADITADLARLEAALARLKAPQGWWENAGHAGALPRRQNPHMHLFEAATALWQATGAPRFGAIAQECLDLLCGVFLQPDGRILEFFDAGWRALGPAEQAVEPGHMGEWVHLLDHWEEVSGRPCGVDLVALFETTRARSDAAGTALPDRSEPPCDTRRLWPQTEFLKAALVLRRRGLLAPQDAALPEAVLAALWRDYLDAPTPGGWYDQRTMDGRLVSDTMPASSFYHVVVALQALARSQA